MYVHLFEATANITAQGFYVAQDDTITRLRFIQESKDWSDRIEDLITHLENTKVVYANLLEGVSPFYFALGCLVAELKDEDGNWQACRVNLLDEEALVETAFKMKGISAMQMIEEVRKIADDLQSQLHSHFPELFPNLGEANETIDFQTIKEGILSINLEDDPDAINATESFWKVEKHFLSKMRSIPINPQDRDYFGKKYINTFTEFTEALGLKESELKEVSIYALFIKQQYAKRKQQKRH
jgi:hypothetical protein